MTTIALIRHGPTAWNAAHRLQGRADMPLSEEGRAEVARWALPSSLGDRVWCASPLSRAVETATMLGLAFEIEPAIVEMDWGAWEGSTRDELIAAYGEEFTQRTAQGLDLRPHGGESPREVRERVAGWVRRVAASGAPTGAVTHHGVIRAALSLATGWSMVGKPPVRFAWAAVHVFQVAEDGAVDIAEMNVSLLPE